MNSYYLTAFLMTKDENDFLKEWVYFHLLQGFEKIFIYDNLSNIPVKETLSDLIKLDKVDVTLWTDSVKNRHTRAMNHCLNRKDFNSVWVALIDTDEFLFGVKMPIKEYLKSNESYSAIKVPWLNYGSSGHVKKPKGLVIESYLWRGDINSQRGGKSIVQKRLVNGMKDPHNIKPVKKNNVKSERDGILQLNHYYTKSKKDWIKKSKRGGGNGVRKVNIEAFKKLSKKYSVVKDTKILKYVTKIKNQIYNV